MVRRQRVDDLVETLARQHLGQRMQREVDAVICDATLGKIVRADALAPIARADLILARRLSATFAFTLPNQT